MTSSDFYVAYLLRTRGMTGRQEKEKKLSHFSHPISIIVTVLLIRLHKQVTLICV